MVSEDHKKYFRELAESFVDTDHVLSNELRDRAEEAL